MMLLTYSVLFANPISENLSVDGMFVVAKSLVISVHT